MRTSITLDDDVYQLASVYASARHITLGAALGELVRKANDPKEPEDGFTIGKNGIPVFSRRGSVITSEMVKAAQEDELE
jgi:hypothetical protein